MTVTYDLPGRTKSLGCPSALTHLDDQGENLSGYGIWTRMNAAAARRPGITADARLATTDGTALAADLH